MLSLIKEKIRKEAFITTWLSILINPSYIIRRGIYKSILYIAPNISGDVLDFGCGSKPYESLFYNAKSYIGVDIEESGHNHKNSKVDYFYDGKTLPFENESFDAVVSFEVFEHVFNINDMILEINRVLKPGGQLLISIPFSWPEHEIPYDFFRFTSYGITRILNKNGFDVTKLIKTTTFVLAIFQIFLAYVNGSAQKKGKVIRIITRLIFTLPFNVTAILCDKLLPKNYDYYCNNVVLAKKISNDPAPLNITKA